MRRNYTILTAIRLQRRRLITEGPHPVSGERTERTESLPTRRRGHQRGSLLAVEVARKVSTSTETKCYTHCRDKQTDRSANCLFGAWSGRRATCLLDKSTRPLSTHC